MDMEDIVQKIKAGIYDLSWKEKRNSAIWNIFAEIRKEDGSILQGFLCCSKCLRLFKFDGKQTSNFNRHKCFSSLKESTSTDNNDVSNQCSSSDSFIVKNLEHSDPIEPESEDSDSQHCKSSSPKLEIYRGSINSYITSDEIIKSPNSDLRTEEIEPEYCETFMRIPKYTEDILQKISDGVYKLSQKRRGKSEIWNVFAEIRNTDGSIVDGYLCCRKCMRLFRFDGKRTSNLNRHKCYSSALKEPRIPVIKNVSSDCDGETDMRDCDPIASQHCENNSLHKFLFDDEIDISNSSSSTDQQKHKNSKEDPPYRIIVNTNFKSQHSPVKEVTFHGDSSKSSNSKDRSTTPGTSQKYAKQLDNLCEMIKADLQDLPEELFFNAKWKIMDVLRDVHIAKLKATTQSRTNHDVGKLASRAHIISINTDKKKI